MWSSISRFTSSTCFLSANSQSSQSVSLLPRKANHFVIPFSEWIFSVSHSGVFNNTLKLLSVSFSLRTQFLICSDMILACCSSSDSACCCRWLIGLMLIRLCKSVKNSSLYTPRWSQMLKIRMILFFTFSSLIRMKKNVKQRTQHLDLESVKYSSKGFYIPNHCRGFL